MQSNNYVVCVYVPGFSKKHMHMTLAFVSNCTEEKIEELKRGMDELRQVLPLRVEYTESDMFGPQNDIPVMKCKIEDQQKLDALKDFYKRFADTADRQEQTFHVSKLKLDHEFEGKTGFTADTMFLKQVGPHDPCYTVQ
jgi:hypothetical protein